ncbi:tyrosine-type recombinase/integrase [Marinoscillum furvescens]|uniref:Tyrosine recombinase XerC n=1 Tax=Marinoscillum furvescens DSM 4134 TaxID=1122208 RepID=A0A3D9L844_MARFU|nr:tyrosine-type recombinase/integrase [Marinoscillum furvescens]REE01655.1 integrase/recombinase XerC [Marinoscillum furvescens DSM 4134]
MIDPFLRYLQAEKRYSKHTLIAYEKDLDQFSEYLKVTFEIVKSEEATHAHLRGWVVELMEAENSPRTINRKIATLKSYYKFLLSRGYIAKNPASRLKPLKTDKKLPTFVRESEITTLLDQVEFTQDFHGLRDRLIIEMLYATGMRLSELIHLKDLDINSFQGTVKVLGKRNKERVIPIGKFLVKLIQDYQRARNELFGKCDFLLVTDKGVKLYPMVVYKTVQKYLSLVTTASKKSPHVLRHTFATHLLNKGADLNAVKDLLGHSSLSATQVYTHNSMEKLKSVFDQAHPKA